MACVFNGLDNWIDTISGAPCSPFEFSGSGNMEENVKIISTPVTGQNVFVGQTTLDKILSATLSGLALVTQQPFVPTTAHPISAITPAQNVAFDLQTQLQLAQLQNASNTSGAGAKFGDSLENFFTNNTGLILIAVIALVLFQSGRK